MPLMNSSDPQVGQACPEFNLPSVDGKQYQLASFSGSKALLVAFICKHCPYVIAIEDRILSLASDYPINDLQVVGICSNDATTYTEDAPESLHQRWLEKGYGFPYLVDESQEVAHAFGALCTPDMYLYDENRKLYYHGQLDDNWKDPSLVKSEDMRNAVNDLLAGNAPPETQHPSMGCSIKWK